MPLPVRRLLNRLPFPTGSAKLYVRSTWHKPAPFEQWRTQIPFRPAPTLRTNHYRGGFFNRRRLGRLLLRAGLLTVALWLVIESVRGLMLF